MKYSRDFPTTSYIVKGLNTLTTQLGCVENPALDLRLNKTEGGKEILKKSPLHEEIGDRLLNFSGLKD